MGRSHVGLGYGDFLTLGDLAHLSSAVYTNNNRVTPPFWEEVMDCAMGSRHTGAGDFRGFFGTAYLRRKSCDLVVAYRGTADMKDIVDDLMMSPVKNAAGAGEFGRKFMLHYLKRSDLTADTVGKLFERIYKTRAAQSLLASYANRIPEDHARPARQVALRAAKYAKKNGFNLRCFVGHSLGGALAQYASEQTGPGGNMMDDEITLKRTPGVAFNAPCMGNIAGMRRGHGGGLLIVHAELDPLSLATNLAGNASHGGRENLNEFQLKAAPPYGERPPDVSDLNNSRDDMDKNAAVLKISAWLGPALLYYHDIYHLRDWLLGTGLPGKILSSFSGIATFEAND
jgi:hypothetical protein